MTARVGIGHVHNSEAVDLAGVVEPLPLIAVVELAPANRRHTDPERFGEAVVSDDGAAVVVGQTRRHLPEYTARFTSHLCPSRHRAASWRARSASISSGTCSVTPPLTLPLTLLSPGARTILRALAAGAPRILAPDLGIDARRRLPLQR
jgi:hypothetical protein